MSTIYIVGSHGNILEDAASFTASSADSNFGTSFIADGDPGTVFRFGSAAANSNVVADLNLVPNGGFEDGFTSGVPDGWTNGSTGDGALSEETTTVNNGSSSLKLTTGGSGTGEAIAYVDVELQAGQACSITGALYENSSSTVRIKIINLDTGKWLDSSEAWQSSDSTWFSRTAASWSTDGPSTFTVEADTVADRAFYTIRVQISIDGTNSEAFADDIAIWPHWDFAALFGAEYPPTVTARVRSDDNAGMSSPTNRVAFTFGRPGIYGQPASTVTERYAQIYFDGTPSNTIEFSEWVLGTTKTLTNGILLPFNASTSVAFNTSPTRGGRAEPVSIERDSSRDFEIRTYAKDFTELRTLHRELFDGARWGGGRMIIVPDDTKPEVYYGWLDRPTESLSGTHWFVSAAFHGMGFPVRVR